MKASLIEMAVALIKVGIKVCTLKKSATQLRVPRLQRINPVL